MAMRRRARWIKAGFPIDSWQFGTLLDVGSGTGHFAEVIRNSTQTQVAEVDVCDFSLTSSPPRLFDGFNLPMADKSFDAVSLLAILQYCEEPGRLLREAARTARSKILILQTLSTPGKWQTRAHKLEELIQGRLAWRVARLAGCFKEHHCPLTPARYLTEDSFSRLMEQNFEKWRTVKVHKSGFPGIRHHFCVVDL